PPRPAPRSPSSRFRSERGPTGAWSRCTRRSRRRRRSGPPGPPSSRVRASAVALATALALALTATAAASPGSASSDRLTSLPAYEREAVEAVLARRGLVVDDRPDGKRIHRTIIVNLDVFA